MTAPSHDHAWTPALRGKFVVFDGPDGSGKSTQLQRFAAWSVEQGLELCQVREPGGTAIGEAVRAILLDKEHADMDVRCEMLLYMASRAQLVAERIAPALAVGQLVLADRFISSTLAYQGTAGGLHADDILQVGRVALSGIWPDLYVIFDVDEQTAASRLSASPKAKPRAGRKPTTAPGPTLFSDRIEAKDQDFHRRVRQGYLDQAAADPARYLILDARHKPDEVFDALLAALRHRFSPSP